MAAPDLLTVFIFGNFCFDRRAGGLFRYTEGGAAVPIPLGSRALELLGVLLERHGDLVSKPEIMAAVWPATVVEAANLAVQISALRRALNEPGSNGGWIQTVPGRGYRFVGSVTRRTAGSPTSDTITPTSDTITPTSNTMEREPAAGAAVRESLPLSGASGPGQSLVAAPASRWRVGRDAPLRTLDGLFRRMLAGDRQMVFITGEAGIGKTTLLEMAMERVSRQDFGVLWGCCTELFGTAEPFLPLIEALQMGCAGPNGALLLKALRNRAPTWLAQMPAFLNAEDRTVFQNEIFGATRERMLREFCDLMEVVSEQNPWIIILEDLHWSDFATLDVLSRFARRGRKASILILASYRPIDVLMEGHPVLTVHHDLRIHGHCAEIALDRLSEEDVERYLTLRFAGITMARGLSRRIFSRTNGHPLFVVSLVDDLVDREAIRLVDGRWHLGEEGVLSKDNIPRNARDMLTRQINRLSVDDQGLLEVASAAGAEFSAAAVTGVTGGDVLAVEQSFEALARKGHILNAAGVSDWPDGTCSGHYTFQHALYQDVLYQRLAPGQRVQIHRRLGETLEAGYQARTADIAAMLALHFEEGRDFTKAIRYLGLIAGNAAKRFANQEAAQYLTRALDLVDRLAAGDRVVARISLLRQRGWALRSAGDLAGSLGDLRTVISLAAETNQSRLEVTGLMDLSRFSLFADRRQCLSAADRAVELSQALDDDILGALVRGSGASINLYFNGWRDEDAELCRQAIRLTANARDPGIAMRRCAIEGTLNTVSGDYQVCRAAMARGKELAREAGDVFMFGLNNIMESFALLYLGEFGEARRRTAAALAMTERNGGPDSGVLCRVTMGWLHVMALDFASALTWSETNYHPAFDTNPFIFFCRRIVLAKAYLGLRDYPAAWMQLSGIKEKSDGENGNLDYPIRVEFYHCVCEYWLNNGKSDKAREWATRLRDLTSRAPDRNYLALAHRLLARIAIAENNADEARGQLSCAISTLENTELPLAAWRVHLTSVAFHERVGERDIAADHRARLEGILQTLAAPFDQSDPLRSSLLRGGAPEADL
jgi:DNA-binding winged helix-turn-helix (wHTH) protein/tetratricopeptide (TPR) repeat protein